MNNLSETRALYLCAIWLALATALQSVELLQIRSAFKETGVWRWSVIRREFGGFPCFLGWTFDRLMNYPVFVSLLFVRIVASFAVLWLTFVVPGELHPILSCSLFILFLTTVLIAVRWRGTFNGGSDYMTVIVSLSLWVAVSLPEFPQLAKACLWYIALQTCISFFISGIAKIRRRPWRTGEVLKQFLVNPGYDTPPRLKTLFERPVPSFVGAWFILVFECSFPIALWGPKICAIYIGLALSFHLLNVYVFGLNRFLFAWLAAYPALYYCSQF